MEKTPLPVTEPVKKINNLDDFKKCFVLNKDAKIESFDDVKLQNINIVKPLAIDFRYVDLNDFLKKELSKIIFKRSRLRNMKEIFENCVFSTMTVFPDDKFMPEGFKKADRERRLELGKFKDFMIPRQYNATGKGVKVAIIDQPLNIYIYPEIAGKIKPENYFVIAHRAMEKTSMHGIVLSSILCGKEIGIAPDVELYYFSIGDWKADDVKRNLNKYYANALDKILEINRGLQSKGEEPIKIVVASDGLTKRDDRDGWDELERKLKEAENAGVTVLHTALIKQMEDAGKKIAFSGFRKGIEGNIELCPWQYQTKYLEPMKNFMENNNPQVFVPMASRTTPDYRTTNGKMEFIYDHCMGGLSWTIPYAAGLFAVARQINPNIELEEFYEMAQNSGRDFKVNGVTVGKIIQPEELVRAINISVGKPNPDRSGTFVERASGAEKGGGRCI